MFTQKQSISFFKQFIRYMGMHRSFERQRSPIANLSKFECFKILLDTRGKTFLFFLWTLIGILRNARYTGINLYLCISWSIFDLIFYLQASCHYRWEKREVFRGGHCSNPKYNPKCSKFTKSNTEDQDKFAC